MVALELVKNALNTVDRTEIIELKTVTGGSINDSYYVKTRSNEYFIKTHPQAPDDFFKKEVEGLDLIRKTNSIAVPEIYAYSDLLRQSFLILEWIEGNKNEKTDLLLGRNIALLHEHHNEKHGFSCQTYTGFLPLKNQLSENWLEFYRDSRLKGQYDIGVQKGTLYGKRLKSLDYVLSHLYKWIPHDIKPSYLHGDLWSGNWIIGNRGIPYVIDPSFLYGDRHFDLAFTELFGGFSTKFYEAYDEQYPIDNYYEDVKDLYQLYYLLVHLNIFGETYGHSVDAILRKYVNQ